MFVASFVHFISAPNTLPSVVLNQLSASSSKVHIFLFLGLLFSSVGGLVVAAVLKKLDNVVKVSLVTKMTQEYVISKSQILL